MDIEIKLEKYEVKAIIEYIKNYMIITYNYSTDDVMDMIKGYGFDQLLMENPEIVKETGLEYWAGRIAENFKQ